MGRPLRAVPETAPRALGLIRVSKERDGMVSPDIQRVAIADYAAARGYDVADWLEGIDESGSRAKSAWWPRLDQAVAAVESGEFDVIVVWKFSRAARHRLRWASALDRIENAGGRLESATEQIDVSTSAGQFTRGMFGEIAAFEAARTGEGWKEAHASRVRAGKPINGKPRFGYVYDPDQKLHVPDPETGPVLADLYRRYVAGESVHALVRWLNRHGHQTVPGYGKKEPGPWSDRSLRRVLDSGFASGRFMAGGDTKRKIPPTLHDGVHEALIDDALWQAYLDARETRRARPARSERSQYLLSGLVRCDRCEGPMVAGQFGEQHAPKYRCKNGKEFGPTRCTGGYVMASYVEREVYDWLRELADEADAARRAHAASGRQRTRAESDEKRLAREITKAEEALARLAVENATNPLPQTVYRNSRGKLEQQIAELTAALEHAGRGVRSVHPDPAQAARTILETWETRPVEHRREGMRQIISEVRVRTGKPRAVIDVVGTWEA